MSMLTPHAAAKKLGVTTRTLINWADQKKIKAVITPGKQRRYDISTIAKNTDEGKLNFCYCRVSSKKQEGNLENQAKFLSELFPGYIIIKDIASGLNYDRKGLKTILDAVFQGIIGRVVVAYKDRLTRFGFEHFQDLIRRGGGELMVLNNPDMSPEQELTEDLIAIVTTFSARAHGLRRYQPKIEDNNDEANKEPKALDKIMDKGVK